MLRGPVYETPESRKSHPAGSKAFKLSITLPQVVCILAPTVNLEINTIQNYDTGCLSLIPFISEQHHETIKQSDNHEHHSLEALKLM